MNAGSVTRPGADWAQDRLRRLGARLASGCGRVSGVVGRKPRRLAAAARARAVLGFDRDRLLLQLHGETLQLRLQQGGELRDLGSIPGRWRSMARAIDPLAPLLPPRTRRPAALAAAAGRRPVCAAAWRCRPPPPNACATWSASRSTARPRSPPMPSPSTRAYSAAATATAARCRTGGGAAPAAGSAAGRAGAAGADAGRRRCRRQRWRAARGQPAAPAQRRHHGDPLRYWNLALVAIALLARRRDACGSCWTTAAPPPTSFEQTIASHATGARASRRRSARQLIDLIEGQAFLERTRARPPDHGRSASTNSPGACPTAPTWKSSRSRTTRITADRPQPRGLVAGRSACEGSPLWRAPALTGALQPDPRSGRDRFTLTAELGRRRRKSAPRARRPAMASDARRR